MKTWIYLCAASVLACGLGCGGAEIIMRNTDQLEERFRSGETKLHRGTKRIGEDCQHPSECESGGCLLPLGICSLSCASAGCPLFSLDGSEWPTVCVPAPGGDVCTRVCDDMNPCPSARTSCEAGRLVKLCVPAQPVDEPPIDEPPIVVEPKIGEECPTGSECPQCIQSSDYPRGLCTLDCTVDPCPDGSVCVEKLFAGRPQHFCFASCESTFTCAAEGTACQEEPSGALVCR